MVSEIGQTTHVLRSLALRVRHELQETLHAGCEVFGTQVGLFTELRGAEHWIQQVEGEATSCRRESRFALAELLDDRLRQGPIMAQDLRDLSVELAGDVRTFVGQVVRLEGEVIGIICFFSLEVCEAELLPQCRVMLDLMALRISSLRERLRVESTLRRSEQRFRRFFLLSVVGMAMIQVDREWGTVNQKLAEILGYSRHELERMKWDSVTHPDDLAQELLLWGETLRGEREGYSIEKRFVRSDGRVVYAAVATRCIWTDDDQVESVIAIVEDLTRQREAEVEGKRLQSQLVDIQKLESLGLLAGGIAHDFNNLLTGVVGNAHLAKAEIESGHGAQRYLDSVLVAAERAAKLTSQLLAYSGKGAFVLRALDVSASVNGMAALLHSLIPKKVELRLDMGVKLPTIHADESQLQQVVMSLVMNSAEAIEGTGTVWISTGTRFLETADLEAFVLAPDLPPGKYIYLEVRDTGHGMQEEVLAKIFDPFFSTKFTGRGLGLAAVLGIVRGHGAALRVRSTPGKGSAFTIYFSAHSPSSKHRLKKAGEGGEGKPLVLVVDDEELVRSACCLSLRLLGYASISASGGREALEMFKGRRDDLVAVVLDMTMPDMDGVETYKLMREISDTVPVIMTSGYSEGESLARLDVPPADFLPKPYAPHVLGEKLSRLLGT